MWWRWAPAEGPPPVVAPLALPAPAKCLPSLGFRCSRLVPCRGAKCLPSSGLRCSRLVPCQHGSRLALGLLVDLPVPPVPVLVVLVCVPSFGLRWSLLLLCQHGLLLALGLLVHPPVPLEPVLMLSAYVPSFGLRCSLVLPCPHWSRLALGLLIDQPVPPLPVLVCSARLSSFVSRCSQVLSCRPASRLARDFQADLSMALDPVLGGREFAAAVAVADVGAELVCLEAAAGAADCVGCDVGLDAVVGGAGGRSMAEGLAADVDTGMTVRSSGEWVCPERRVRGESALAVAVAVVGAVDLAAPHNCAGEGGCRGCSVGPNRSVPEASVLGAVFLHDVGVRLVPVGSLGCCAGAPDFCVRRGRVGNRFACVRGVD